MPIKELPSDTPLDAPTSKVTELPSGTRLDPGTGSGKPPQPRTTGSGLIGSAERGIAPYVTGAAVGAAAGAPFAGIGAIPGAAAGIGAVALTQLATSVYGHVADALGWPKAATPQEMTDRVLDYAGVKRPSTPTERVVEAGASSFGGAVGAAKAAEQVAEKAAGPVTKVVAEKLADKPVAQAVVGTTGGAAGQTAKEAGAPLWVQKLVEVAPGFLPTVGSVGARIAPKVPVVSKFVAGEVRPAAQEARASGYVLPPGELSENPDVVSKGLAAVSGKVKTQQAASTKNQSVTNNLATSALNLPKDAVLNQQVFDDIRTTAGKAYAEVAHSVPLIKADGAYDQVIGNLSTRSGEAAKFFPETMHNPHIEALVTELAKVRQFSPQAGLEIVKKLRADANANFRVRDDPSKVSLAFAQRDAADAIDALMERNITAAGKPEVIANYRDARQLIARSYDLEAATNLATGDVSAPRLAVLARRGRPLTGELETIAKTAAAFPKSMQPPSGFGYEESWSVLDAIAAGAYVATGHPWGAALSFGRPLARATVLSDPYQRVITGGPADAAVAPPLILPMLQNAASPGIAPYIGDPAYDIISHRYSPPQ